MISMRDAFLDKLYDIAKEDRRVVLLSNDFGAPSLDRFRVDLPSQFIHIGVAEQNMVNVAAGLALAGKIVYMYSIAPFLPLRCYEQIRVNLCFRNLHVTGVGVGAGYSYDFSGPSHHALEDISVMAALPGMTILNASDSAMAVAFAEISYKNPGPTYVRLDREIFPIIYNHPSNDFSQGLATLKTGRDLTIIATGIMVHQAFAVAQELAKSSIDAGIVDLYRIKPVNEEFIINVVEQSKQVVTLEENFLSGGIGSIVMGVALDRGKNTPLKRIGISDKYLFEYSGRKYLHKSCGLDVTSIARKILEWLEAKGGL